VLTAIPLIPLAVGASRVVRGIRVEHVCGNPNLSEQADRELMMRIVDTALRALQTRVEGPTLFDPADQAATEVAHAS
jgi:hypothetical protein